MDAAEVNGKDRERLENNPSIAKVIKEKGYSEGLINAYTQRDVKSESLSFKLNYYMVKNSQNEFLESYERQLSSVLKRMPKYEGVVYRGVNLSNEALERYEKAKGKMISEPFFVSATKDVKKVYEGNTVFKIIGNKPRDIESISNHQEDKEVLFDAHTVFRVISIKKEDGKTQITLKEKI